jgi:hypothetical protein
MLLGLVPQSLRRRDQSRAAPLFRFRPRDIRPADILRIFQDAGLNGLMFAGFGHG